MSGGAVLLQSARAARGGARRAGARPVRSVHARNPLWRRVRRRDRRGRCRRDVTARDRAAARARELHRQRARAPRRDGRAEAVVCSRMQWACVRGCQRGQARVRQLAAACASGSRITAQACTATRFQLLWSSGQGLGLLAEAARVNGGGEGEARAPHPPAILTVYSPCSFALASASSRFSSFRSRWMTMGCARWR